jgi:serine/threonine protein kinase
VKEPVRVALGNNVEIMLTAAHLTPCYGWVLRSPFYGLAMKYIPRDLSAFINDIIVGRSQWLQSSGRVQMPHNITTFAICKVLADVAHGLAFVHIVHKLVHRDVHSRNILVDDDGRAYLTDYGLVTPMGQPTQVDGAYNSVPPAAWAAREAGGLYGYPDGSCDVYGLSYTMLSIQEQLIAKTPPHILEMQDDRIRRYRRDEILFGVWPELIELRNMCAAMSVGALYVHYSLERLLLLKSRELNQL